MSHPVKFYRELFYTNCVRDPVPVPQVGSGSGWPCPGVCSQGLQDSESLCAVGSVIYLKRHNKCAWGILGRQDLCLVFGGQAEPFEGRWAGFGQVGTLVTGRAAAFEPRLRGGELWTVFIG